VGEDRLVHKPKETEKTVRYLITNQPNQPNHPRSGNKSIKT
jgi:hypothetical protein